MNDWLLTFLQWFERFRTSHDQDLPLLPVSAQLLLTSAAPALVLVCLLNVWLPRHHRLLRAGSALRTYVEARPRQASTWVPGALELERAMGVQPFRWGLAGLGCAFVGLVHVANVLAVLASPFGRKLIRTSPEVKALALSPHPLAFWLAAALGLLVVVLLAVPGRVPQLGGPLRRLPAFVVWFGVVLVCCWRADAALDGRTFTGPLVLLVASLVPVVAGWQRRHSVAVPSPPVPAWVSDPRAHGAPQTRVRPKPVRAKVAPVPAAPARHEPEPALSPTKVDTRASLRDSLKIHDGPIGSTEELGSPTVVLDPIERSAQAAFGPGHGADPAKSWNAIARDIAEVGPTDPVRLGEWTVDGLIGSGGMARVYRGVSASGQRAAIKVPKPSEQLPDEGGRTRLANEVRALERVKVYGVAQLRDSGVTDGLMWIAMNYVGGPTLEQAVKRCGPITGRRYLRTLATRTAEIISHVHASNVMHRDIKPANVILNTDGPTLIDLGIAILADESSRLTQTGMVVGTALYLPPEVIVDGRSPTPAVDVYAWGCLMAYAALGKPVYSGPAAALGPRIQAGRWDAGLRRQLEQTDKKLYQLVCEATHRDLALRPPDGAALHARCRELLSG